MANFPCLKGRGILNKYHLYLFVSDQTVALTLIL